FQNKTETEKIDAENMTEVENSTVASEDGNNGKSTKGIGKWIWIT
ncbi:hypothetical protein A2U01_0014453, partial [Trifolium medium]|nr:hypothetical protein [Trifolium medium]